MYRVGHRVRSRIRFFVSLGGHRCAQASPKVAIGRPMWNGPSKIDEKSMPWAPPGLQKCVQTRFSSRLPSIYKNCAAVLQQDRVRKNSRRFCPPGDCFQKLAMLLSSASAYKKIGDRPVPPDSVSKNADGPDLPVIFQHPQTQQRQASPCSHSPQRGG